MTETAAYNTAELYALQQVQIARNELRDGSRSDEMISSINDLVDRHGTVGLASMIAALARFGVTELAGRADREGTSIDELIDGWVRHKLEQQQHPDDDS